MGLQENVAACRDMVNCTDLILLGDGDTGFGGSGNVRRTIEGYAKAGFAGVSIEDQVYPKRCAYSGGVAVVPREDRPRASASMGAGRTSICCRATFLLFCGFLSGWQTSARRA